MAWRRETEELNVTAEDVSDLILWSCNHTGKLFRGTTGSCWASGSKGTSMIFWRS